MSSSDSMDPPDVDRGVAFAAIFIVECAITTIIVALRFWARWKIRKIASDDWVMLATWVCHVVFTVMSAVLGLQGGTRHLQYIPLHTDDPVWLIKLNWVSQPSGILALGLGKISVALLILRIQGNDASWRKWLLHIVLWLTLIFTALTVAFTFAQCDNPEALWNEELKSRYSCWEPTVQKNFSTFSASWNVFVDFLLAFLPITLVKDLNMARKRKIGLSILLGLGIFTGVCAAIKVNQLVSLAVRDDFTWATYELFIWTNTEGALVIICGSVPALKPLYKLYRGESISCYGGGSGYLNSKNSRSSYPLAKTRTIGNELPNHRFEVQASPHPRFSRRILPASCRNSDNDTLHAKSESQHSDQIRLTRTFEVDYEERGSKDIVLDR